MGRSVGLDARTGTGSLAGTLNSTIMMSAGQQTNFFLVQELALCQFGPPPDMLWPTLVGMVSMAILREERRRKVSISG